MARSKQQQPGAQTTNTGGGNIIYREGPIVAFGNSIRILETELSLQRGMFNTLMQGGTIGRAGAGGGVQVGRSGTTGGTGGNGEDGALSNPAWIAQLLSLHTEGLTAGQIREYATQAGRTMGASFPHDSFNKMRARKEVRKTGSGVNSMYRLTQQGIGRMEKAGTANLPAGRVMTATG